MAGKKMAYIKLKYLNMQVLVDVAFLCGRDRTPVFIYIAADPGSGKTWATKSLEQVEGVTYFSSSTTPNEYRTSIQQICKRTRLFEHDDIGRCPKPYIPDYISTFCDMCEGHVSFRQYKKSINCSFNFSVVLTSTIDFYFQWKDIMKGCGLLDRMLTFILELDDSTRKKYQEKKQDDATMGCVSNEPEKRIVIDRARHGTLNVEQYDIDPRNMTNILRMSQYMTKEELAELVNVVHSDMPKYSI